MKRKYGGKGKQLKMSRPYNKLGVMKKRGGKRITLWMASWFSYPTTGKRR